MGKRKAGKQGRRTKTVPMVDMVNEVMHKRRQQLIDKFVREPGPEDPVFFDPYSDNPQVISEEQINSMMIEALSAAGVDPAVV